jgi:maleate isomerase
MGDPLGYRLKLGVVTPSTNTVVQPEYDDMRPVGVTNHVARIHIPEKPIEGDAGFTELVAAIDSSLDLAVEQVLTCKPDSIVLGVSIEAVWGGGIDAAAGIEERLRARFGSDLRLTHAADALPAALRALGVEGGEVGIVTPYMPVAESHIATFLAQTGYSIAKARHLCRPSPIGIAETTEKQLRDALTEVAAVRPQAIVQFGANLCMGRLAAEAERWLELPVIAVNTATYWYGLRQNGINDQIRGFGSLLAEH